MIKNIIAIVLITIACLLHSLLGMKRQPEEVKIHWDYNGQLSFFDHKTISRTAGACPMKPFDLVMSGYPVVALSATFPNAKSYCGECIAIKFSHTADHYHLFVVGDIAHTSSSTSLVIDKPYFGKMFELDEQGCHDKGVHENVIWGFPKYCPKVK